MSEQSEDCQTLHRLSEFQVVIDKEMEEPQSSKKETEKSEEMPNDSTFLNLKTASILWGPRQRLAGYLASEE